jgi:undecaprenyl-diphosphatase
MGLVLLYADRAVGRKTVADIDTRDGVAIGLAQSLALVPGVSRSGATISAGLFLGYTREAAARFSFLLSIPAVVLSGLFSLKDLGAGDGAGPMPTVVATVVSFAVGYAAIAWFLKFLVSHSTRVFVAYRVALGTLLLVLLATNTISAR